MAKKKPKSKSGGGGKGKDSKLTMVAENRKARHRFEILDSIECGMMLMGSDET